MNNTTPYEMDPSFCKSQPQKEEEEQEHEQEEEEEEDYIDAAEIKECTTPRRSSFTTLTESKIKECQETEINGVSSVLSVPKSEACLLLIHHGWSAMKVKEAWFDDEERVRKLVGLLENNSKEIITPQTCQICFNDDTENEMESAKCGHAYFVGCWKNYIDEKIQEVPHECLKPMRCPHPSCEASLEIGMIQRFASETNKKMYDSFLLRSYVETRKNIKWCPSRGCDLAVVYESDGNDGNKYVEVSCSNGHRFCWRCGEDAHRGVSCETMAKKKQEAESLRWISAFTKKCPGCKKPIEKNGGCMCMTCTSCNYQFCWLCLSDWSLPCRRECYGFHNA